MDNLIFHVFYRIGVEYQNSCQTLDVYLRFATWIGQIQSKLLNPKGGGGGSKCPIGQEIGSHFSQDHAMVTKILDFIHKHPN